MLLPSTKKHLFLTDKGPGDDAIVIYKFSLIPSQAQKIPKSFTNLGTNQVDIIFVLAGLTATPSAQIISLR